MACLGHIIYGHIKSVSPASTASTGLINLEYLGLRSDESHGEAAETSWSTWMERVMAAVNHVHNLAEGHGGRCCSVRLGCWFGECMFCDVLCPRFPI